MTINDAINRVDSLKPNDFGISDKVKWLSEIERRIYDEIILTHEGADDVTFAAFNDDTPLDTVLLCPDDYAVLYVHFLEAQIDFYNAEIAKYNNSIETFNTVYSLFERWYNRTHMPKGARMRYF